MGYLGLACCGRPAGYFALADLTWGTGSWRMDNVEFPSGVWHVELEMAQCITTVTRTSAHLGVASTFGSYVNLDLVQVESQ